MTVETLQQGQPFQISDSEAPAGGAEAVTKSDTADNFFRSLYIGTAGNLIVEMASGEVVTFVGISGFAPIRVNKVLSTLNTASDIVGLK